MQSKLALLLATTLTLAACGGSSSDESAPPTSSTTSSTTAAPTTTSATIPEDFAPFVVAEAIGQTIDVYAGPSGGDPVRTLDKADEISGKIVFLAATGESAERLEVFLPVRPNGSTGWVDREAVALSRHGFLIEVNLGAHELTLYDGPEIVFETEIGVGTTDTPTPGGVFFVKELLQPPTPDSVYGTYAYGLSGFSTVFESFSGGDGVIGIHGTNDPSSIGSDVSAGCIRLRNDDIERLVEQIGLPLGTPVAINA